jgi:drug/metabolite transporter (DMT)-like permease
MTESRTSAEHCGAVVSTCSSASLRTDAEPSRLGPIAAVTAGVTGMICVGGSVAVSAGLAGAPVATAQALRYALACLLLVAARRRSVPWPRGRQWWWLLGVVTSGMVLFNVALVLGGEHAEPAVLGVAVACVPLVLAAVGPIAQGRRPSPRVLAAAFIVTTGAVLVQGQGRCDPLGLAWAAVVLACEAGFTLLALPVLPQLGAWGVSVHTTWLAAAVFAVLAVAVDGPTAVLRLTAADLAAVAYLAGAVTALAFVLWYSCVRHLGAGRAGLLTGVAPAAATATGVLLGGPLPQPPVLLGVTIVAAGLALGLTPTS